jgi:hypothetical protein
MLVVQVTKQEGHYKQAMAAVAEEKANAANCQRNLQDAEQVALRVTKALEDTRKECQELRKQAGEVGSDCCCLLWEACC